MILEIQSVCYNWKHPKDPRKQYIPLRDASYHYVFDEWQQTKDMWEKGLIPDPEQCFDFSDPTEDEQRWVEMSEEYRSVNTFEDVHGPMPNPMDYRPDWMYGLCTCGQLYDAERFIPVSPVFITTEEMSVWAMKSLALKDLQVFRLPLSKDEGWLLAGMKIKWRGQTSYRQLQILKNTN